MSEWISVEDKLPAKGEGVICCVKRFTMNGDPLLHISEYEYSLTGRWLGFYYQGIDYISDIEEKVTHWMPMPEPPSE